MMFKLSQYVVEQGFQDKKDGKTKVVLLNTRKSNINLMDANTFNKIKQGQFDSIDGDLLNKLIQSNIVVEKNRDELSEVLKENNQYINSAKELYYVLQPSAFCPFGCHYCGQLHAPDSMSEETQQQTVARVESKLKKNTYESLRICWFGGEPLAGISSLRKLSRNLQSLAQSYKMNYSSKIVTNGWNLNPDIARELIHEHKINHIEITLDGDQQFHDARRHTKGGKNTFNQIYENLLFLCRNETLKQTHVSIRCNVDERNTDGISPLIRRLAEDNLQRRVVVYFAQIHSWGNSAHELAASKEKFSEWEIEWMLEMESLGFHVNYLPSRKKQVCMTLGKNSELIDPHGGVFKCTEISLVPSYDNEDKVNRHQLGHINQGDKELTHNEFGNFYDEEEIKNFFCHKCEIFPVCGGSCPKEWKEGRIPCPSIKFNLKQRMMLHYIKKDHMVEYEEIKSSSRTG